MERFSSLRYPVHKTIESFDKAFPDLFRLPEFKKLQQKKPDWEQITKYIVLLYDPGSELIQEFQNLQERKEAAAVEAGYVRGPGGRWPKDLIKMMQIRDEQFHSCVMAYLKIFKNAEHTDIMVTEEEMDQMQKLRFKAIDDKSSDLYGDAKKKDGLMEAVAKRRASLKILYQQFRGDNIDLDAPEFDEMITPENADRILATMPPPYEEIKPEEPANVLSNP